MPRSTEPTSTEPTSTEPDSTVADSSVSTSGQQTAKLGAALIGTLALLSAIAPLATDLYLSAFPTMTVELSTTTTGVQLSLTTFLIGAGLGQVIFGPLSDRVGRRGPLLVGMVIYLVSSIVATVAPTVEVLVVARLVQGLSGAAGMVLSRAIIADMARAAAAARALSTMMLVSAIAPITAPFLGSVLVNVIGWRGLLGIVAALGAVSIILVLVFVKESRPPQARREAPRKDQGRLLSRRYLGYTLTYGFSFATMMAYISASPFVYQTMMGMTEIQYGLAFAVNAIAMAATGAVGAKLVGRISPATITWSGLFMNLVAILALVVVAFSGAPAFWLTIPLLFAVASLGLIVGNTTALALEAVPGRSGSASAWLGCLQFLLAGIVSALVGLGGEETAVPLALTMLGASIIALFAFLVARRAPEPEAARENEPARAGSQESVDAAAV